MIYVYFVVAVALLYFGVIKSMDVSRLKEGIKLAVEDLDKAKYKQDVKKISLYLKTFL